MAQTDSTTAPSHPYIRSDRVEGTAVYDADGSRIGTIKHLEIEKVSGQVVYAITSFISFSRRSGRHAHDPLEQADVRSAASWLSNRHHPGAASQRARVLARGRVRLARTGAGTAPQVLALPALRRDVTCRFGCARLLLRDGFSFGQAL